MRNIIEYKNLTWVDIIEPTGADIEYLKDAFKLHSLTLKTIIPAIHHPDLYLFEDYIHFILHYPHYQENNEIQIQELDIVAGKDYLITNHYQVIRPINTIFEECSKNESKKAEYMGQGSSFFLFTLLNSFLRENLAKLDRLENEIDSVEKKIFQGQEKEMVKDISYLKRRIIAFWRIADPQGAIFNALRDGGTKFFGQELEPYFSDLYRIHRRIENILKTSKETIESLEETNHILVSLRMNEIIRVLTLFSAILLPLTFLASIWGMNTNFLPFAKTSFDFWLIISLMVITSSWMIIYFRIKRWF